MATNKKTVPVKKAPTKTQSERPSYVKKENYDIPTDSLPAIKIIQSLSPEKLSGDEKHIAGAAEGMLFNSETRQLFDGTVGILVSPLEVRKSYVEWMPRKLGGGFVAAYPDREAVERSFTQGNELQTTIEFLAYNHDDGSVCVVRFDTPGKLGTARRWGRMIQEKETMEGGQYRLAVILKKNKQNQPYYTFTITFADWTPADIYAELAAMKDSTHLPPLLEGNSKSDGTPAPF